MGNLVLAMKNISKNFGSTQALKDVSFDVEKGEVHMLLGENGAGKSTLMRILAGSILPDSGEIFLDNTLKTFSQPSDAIACGIGMVYQELALHDDMSIFENILMGNLPRKKGLKTVDWKVAKKTARKILKMVGLEDIDYTKPLRTCNLGVKQLVEIAKALSKNTRILILDEPTSALTESEVVTLFKIIKNLKKEDVSFIFITHKLDEVFEIGDRTTVFRDGKKIGETRQVGSGITESELVRDMVGRTITQFYPKEVNVDESQTILDVKNLSDDKHFHDVNFDVKKGEVVGVAGLVGSGRSEMMEAIFGLRTRKSGEVIYNGKPYNPKNPKRSLENKIGLLTKSRKSGLLLHMPIYRNITLSNEKKYVVGKFFRKRKAEVNDSKEYVEKLKIACQNVLANSGSLSGGNQQKVVISKLLCADCKLFILDDPTRGIDVGAKVQVYKIINELTKNGCGVIFISSEMPEILGMSDKVLVARKGTIVSSLPRNECTQEVIMHKIAGGN